MATNPVADALRLSEPSVLGFDFPIGLPTGFAAKVGINSFVALLPQLGWRQWREFFTPAAEPRDLAPSAVLPAAARRNIAARGVRKPVWCVRAHRSWFAAVESASSVHG